jgi:formyltetrahydrofolate deformylase
LPSGKFAALLESPRVDSSVLARYMQILSPDVVNAYEQLIINIHHSFLPADVGAKSYHQAFVRGVKLMAPPATASPKCSTTVSSSSKM